jgi:hypothetical protein
VKGHSLPEKIEAALLRKGNQSAQQENWTVSKASGSEFVPPPGQLSLLPYSQTQVKKNNKTQDL